MADNADGRREDDIIQIMRIQQRQERNISLRPLPLWQTQHAIKNVKEVVTATLHRSSTETSQAALFVAHLMCFVFLHMCQARICTGPQISRSLSSRPKSSQKCLHSASLPSKFKRPVTTPSKSVEEQTTWNVLGHKARKRQKHFSTWRWKNSAFKQLHLDLVLELHLEMGAMYSIDPMIKLYFLHFYNLSYVFVKSRCLLHVSNFLHPWNISTETLEASPMSQVTGINSFAENPSKGLKIVLSQIECRLSSPNSKACKCMHIYIYIQIWIC